MKKYFGAIIIVLLLTTTLLAKQVTQKIEVIADRITIMVNGKGTEADTILYNATTYVPLRMVSELLSKDVDWEQTTKTVSINDQDASIKGQEIKEQKVKEKNPVATMIMESGGQIKIELYPEIAPNTVNNFISLINEGFYNGLNFHRVIPGFMIQGGDPAGNGSGGPGYAIGGEFIQNGIQNDLAHSRGVLSMARAQDPNSAGSQFFIMVEDSPFLDGEYAAFGKVIEGMDIADQIVSMERDRSDNPSEAQIIKTMKVELFDKVYKEPITK